MKEFNIINSLNTTKEDWESEGYKVINFANVKKEYLKVIDNIQLAHEYHSYNDITDSEKKPHLKEIHNQFQKIVFKESRGSANHRAIGWENLNTYLDYHSGIIYRWFKNDLIDLKL